jgi:class 3 adenylate cyclase/predicted ATPase
MIPSYRGRRTRVNSQTSGAPRHPTDSGAEQSMKDISQWLASLGLEEKYARTFVDNGIDLSSVHLLTEEDLKELGVLLGHRRRILDEIRKSARFASPTQAAAEAVPAQEDAERRQLTVMFCDLVGSTMLSTQLDPEDMRALIGTYLQCVVDVVKQFDGVVARYLGDGALIYFGYPQAHEDDPVQAVRAGLALVEAVSRLRTAVDATMQVRVGVATGTVVIGDLIGGGAAKEHSVVGETPNLAARLQAAADPGTVLISASTRRLTVGHFEYRDLGLLALKGWAEPTPAWQVIGTSAFVSRFEAEHGSGPAPLIGRQEEIDLLWRRWRSAVKGGGRVVVLMGEPGIGKSRVALGFEKLLASEPHFVLRFFCSAHHTNSPLYPFIAQLERASRFERTDPPAAKLTKLEALLARSSADLARDTALLADLLSLPPGNRLEVDDAGPQKRREATQAALMAQFDGLAAQRPVLLVIEDVQWIDPTSLELLTEIVERAPRLPALVLIAARPQFTAPWPGHAHITTLWLTRLTGSEGAELVKQVAARTPLPEEVVQQILARTDGVPLFVEELTKTVLESNMLAPLDGGSAAIPTTLLASLIARLDRLSPAARELAQIGAVVGREFPYELIAAVAGQPRDRLNDSLNQLIRSELVFRRGEPPRATCIFKHALIRDAAYEGLLKSRRAHWHGAIASALEREFPEVAETQPETVAHHLTEAGSIGRALPYWLQAGRLATKRSAGAEAIAHLSRAIDSLNLVPADPTRDRLELDLQFALAPCLIAIEGPASERAFATFARARELCERIGDAPQYLQVMFWLVTAGVMRGELSRALEGIATLLDRAEERADKAALLNATRGHAMILMFMGRLIDARTAIERAVAAFDASSEPHRLAARAAGQDPGVANLAVMSWILWLSGQVDTAVARIAAALQRADQVDHAHSRAYACYYASVLHCLRDEPAIASQYAQRCIALAEEHGFRQWLSLARAVRGICLNLLDTSAVALDDVLAALAEHRAGGFQLGTTALDVLLCPLLLQRNRIDSALELIERGLATADRNEERLFEAELDRLKALTLLTRRGPGAQQQAQRLLDRALATARRQKAATLELRAARDLASMLVDQGRRAEALALLAPAYDGFTEGFDTFDLRSARELLRSLR